MKKNELKPEIIQLESLAKVLEQFIQTQEKNACELSIRDRHTLQLLDRKVNEWFIWLD